MSFWTLLLDIAGRVAESDPESEFISAAGVVVSSEKCDFIRSQIGKNFPKWVSTDQESAKNIFNILTKESVYFAVYQLQRTQPAWANFWEKGRTDCDAIFSTAKKLKIHGKKKGLVSILQPGNVMRHYLLTNCSSLLLGLSIRDRKLSKIVDSRGRQLLNLEIIVDSDIQGKLNISVYQAAWEKWLQKTKLPSHLNIKPQIDFIKIQSEQEESLLLLPDYLAGILHYQTAPNVIKTPSNLSKNNIENLYSNLKNCPNKAFNQCYFAIDYPSISTQLNKELYIKIT